MPQAQAVGWSSEGVEATLPWVRVVRAARVVAVERVVRERGVGEGLGEAKGMGVLGSRGQGGWVAGAGWRLSPQTEGRVGEEVVGAA